MHLHPRGWEQVSGGVSSSVSWRSWIWFPSRLAEELHAMAREAGEIAICQAGMVVLRRKEELWSSWVVLRRGREFVLNWAAVRPGVVVWMLVYGYKRRSDERKRVEWSMK